jgi:hypothetical protein
MDSLIRIGYFESGQNIVTVVPAVVGVIVDVLVRPWINGRPRPQPRGGLRGRHWP